MNDLEKEFGFIELIYGTIMNPISTFRTISVSTPLFNSFIIFIIVALLSSLTNFLLPTNTFMPSEYSQVVRQAGPYLSILGILAYLILWLLQGGVLQIFGELLGGKSKGLTTLAVIALAEIPKVLVIPFQVINYFKEGSGLGAALYGAATLGTMLWSGFLLIVGLRETHQISTFRAAVAVAAPLMIFILLVILLLAGLIVFLYPMIGSLQGV